MRKRRIATLVTAALALAGGVQANEGGDQYPNGADTWLSGALPPPGGYFLNYLGYYDGELRDQDGDRMKGTSVEAWFDALRYLHVSERKFLGGNWAWHVILPLVHQRADLGAGSRSVDGIGDITINPFALSWHRGNWHWVAGIDFNLPTGRYDSGDPRGSIGANYWSMVPLVGVTYLSADGWEASAKFMYSIKSENDDFRPAPGAPKVDYQSGDEFHFDYLLGKHIGQWGVGLSGYYVKQTTDDEIDGSKIEALPGVWSAGRRGEVFAIGPSVTYTTKKGVHFIGEWHHEIEAENRFGGDKYWFKLILPL
jgi:hypothetical protein